MKGLKQFIQRILLGLNILLLLALIFTSYAVPHLQPGENWPLGLLGLGFPILLLFVVAFILFWLVFRFRYAFLGIVAIVICWPFVSVLLAFHPFSNKNQKAAGDESIKVMSYNVHYFKDFDSSEAANRRLRNKLVRFISEEQPDILCLQEFYTSENPNDNDNKTYLSQKLDLPFYYFSSDHNYKNNHSGVILYSRFPILHAEKLDLLKNNSKSIAILGDVKKGKDTIRVFTTHLQSIYLTGKDMQRIKKIKNQEDRGLKATKEINRKLRAAFKKRGTQARVFREAIKASPYPVLVCGDFNDPPTSYTYFKVKDGLKDAFLQKGFGLGRTFSEIAPTLRIDYIFTDPAFEVLDFNIPKVDYSDHYPIVSRMILNNN